MTATIKLPSDIDPKLYVTDLLKAPRVAPWGKLLLQKYQEPYTLLRVRLVLKQGQSRVPHPETVVWMVFLSHSEIQYPANVANYKAISLSNRAGERYTTDCYQTSNLGA